MCYYENIFILGNSTRTELAPWIRTGKRWKVWSDLMRYKAVIFDLFGTLIDSFSAREYEEVLRRMASVLSVPHRAFITQWLETVDKRMVGFFPDIETNIDHICAILGATTTEESVSSASRIRLEYTSRSIRPREGVLETLAQLKSKGHKIGLVTDCSIEIPLLWEEKSIAPFIDVPVFSCVEGVKKPDPRIYRRACERLHVSPQECLYLGDGGSNELTGASKIGMEAVHICTLHEPDAIRLDVEEWNGPKISTLKEILKLVE